jgi:hypothetical protein
MASLEAWELQELVRVTVTRLQSTRDATMSCIADEPEKPAAVCKQQASSHIDLLSPCV